MRWDQFEIPQGSGPVHVSVVRDGPGARSLFVQFPPQWERTVPGSYASAEEFVVLEGSIEMGGTTWRCGEWAYVPAGVLRPPTRCPDGALAFATFFGPARWGAGGEDRPASHCRLEASADPAALPFGRGWRLRSDGGSTSWYVEPVERAASPYDVEVLSLTLREWAWVPAGTAAPGFEGPWFARTYEAGGEP